MFLEPYSLYYLYDPRNDLICYVGITKQNFDNRLRQHLNPVTSNNSAIA
jgi:hypothetical protein